VLAALAQHGVAAELLQLELTEGALMDDPLRSREQLLHLQAHGVTTAIDDFGTGYSSLAWLADLPVRAVKIDRSFVIGMLGSARVHGIVAATLSMAEALGLDTVAEGVETAEQAEALIALGCRELQGYRYSRPVPAAALRDWAASFDAARWGLVAPQPAGAPSA
jgi:EAL domain-containing protein (putative c-di-GMP-specific phosphodiesterase class I)